MGNRTSAALLALAFACAAAAPARAEAPDGGELLRRVMDPPEVSFQGVMVLTQWHGKQTHSEEAKVYFSPPQRYRCEFRTPSGEVRRVVVSDGDQEFVELVKSRKVLKGDVIKSGEKVMEWESEFDLLMKNYELSVPLAEPVAGRPAWRVSLSPRVAGKPHEDISVDEASDAVLEMKRFLPGGSQAVSLRFVRFESGKPLADSLFQAAPGSAAAHGLSPRFLSLDELNKVSGRKSPFPSELPFGFRFESGDRFQVEGKWIVHARYTDGLAVVSLFVTDRPVRLPTKPDALPDLAEAGFLRLPLANKLLKWKSGDAYFTLIGDVSEDLLRSLSRRFS